MKSTDTNRKQIETLAVGAILTALVVVIQAIGAVIRFGPFSISLVLIPIVIGAAMCGPKVSSWLGFVFGVVVLMTDAGAFLAVSVVGTVITVLLKGTLCGLAAGLVYKVFAKTKTYLAVSLSAVVCPIVNTGIFLLGCFVFFFETVKEWGLAAGFDGTIEYMIVGLVGVNFLIEIAVNVVLCPVVVRILNIVKKNK